MTRASKLYAKGLDDAGRTFAKVLHLWACGYTTESIAREVPSMTTGEVVELITLAHQVIAKGSFEVFTAKRGGAQ